MSKPRIRVINRHGFLAYRVVSMGLNVFYNNIIWFEGKRYLSAGESSIFFRPGRQPAFKPTLRDRCGHFTGPIYLLNMSDVPKLLT